MSGYRKQVLVIAPIEPEHKYDTNSASKVVNVSPDVITAYCRRNELEHMRNGSKYVIYGKALLALAEKQKREKEQKKQQKKQQAMRIDLDVRQAVSAEIDRLKERILLIMK